MMCDYPDAFEQHIRRARKEHHCYESSHHVIRPGDEYEYTSGIWDRVPSSYKTCLPCSKIRDWLSEELRTGRLHTESGEDECGVLFGGLWEACSEAYAEWLLESRHAAGLVRCCECDSGWDGDYDPTCVTCSGKGWVPREAKAA